jgi:hypothetical protein
VRENLNENWRKIDHALCYGLRGLPGGSSLARFLAEHRGARNAKALPPLTEEQLLPAKPARREGTTRNLPAALSPSDDALLDVGLAGCVLEVKLTVSFLILSTSGVAFQAGRPWLDSSRLLY